MSNDLGPFQKLRRLAESAASKLKFTSGRKKRKKKHSAACSSSYKPFFFFATGLSKISWRRHNSHFSA